MEYWKTPIFHSAQSLSCISLKKCNNIEILPKENENKLLLFIAFTLENHKSQ